MTNVASGRGPHPLMISRIGTPSQTLSSFDQRVTQWMSDVTVTRGSFRNSSQVHDDLVLHQPEAAEGPASRDRTAA